MDIQSIIILLVGLALVVLALSVKPLRKTMGLLLVILGGIASFTVIGLVVGIPMIIIGGILLFV